jgi:hypothetical protein
VKTELVEQQRCSCGSQIPRENVRIKRDEKAGTRTIDAYCEHCNIAWRVEQAWSGAACYFDRSAVAVLDEAAKAKLLRELAELRRETFITRTDAKARHKQAQRQRDAEESAFADRLTQDASQDLPAFADAQ